MIAVEDIQDCKLQQVESYTIHPKRANSVTWRSQEENDWQKAENSSIKDVKNKRNVSVQQWNCWSIAAFLSPSLSFIIY